MTVKWITRERAMVDRIACPWLISRFIDKEPEFHFAPRERVLEIAREENMIPFDTPGAELYHFEDGGKVYVSFDSIMRKYRLNDPALLELARIVRGADASIPDAPPESPGLEAAANGFRSIAKDDFENMRLQFPLYDALYAYCKSKVSGEKVLVHSRK